MRLLKLDDDHKLSLTVDFDDNAVPPYAILSHTWGANEEEVTFADLQQGRASFQDKTGYKKILFCGEQARRDGLEYFWVDTCCIDKSSIIELSKAINLMYQWYANSQKCYVYLADVPFVQFDSGTKLNSEWHESFRKSRWFQRGWTLQELLAPSAVEFFSCEGVALGSKKALADQITKITSIPLSALYGTSPSRFSVAERWKWAINRQTKEKEDRAYCLLGIFNVVIPFIYGEGDNAFRRLEEEIIRCNRMDTRIAPIGSAEDFAGRPAKRTKLNDTGADDVSANASLHPDVPNLDADTTKILLKSLLFDRMDFRVNNVKNGLLSTCEWLLNHSDFQDWWTRTISREHSGFLWIKGKPGCGKSTLMKTAFEWARKQKASNHSKRMITSYFFNARAKASLEKSSLGFYRTIVHHVLSSHHFLRPLFIRKFATKDPGVAGENWTKEELQGFLLECIESGGSFKLCLFIDAMDEAEYEDDVREMIAFLRDLSDRTLAAGSVCQVRICLSSRHYPHIKVGRGRSLIVEKQAGQGQDIETYVDKKLMCDSGPDKDTLRSSILSKSARVFLWIVLVVDMLNKLDDQGSTPSDMQARLDTIPADLSDLFKNILLRSDYGLETSVVLFQWMIFSRRTLEPAELFVAIQCSLSPSDPNWFIDGPINPPPLDRLTRSITDCSRGLVEIVTSADNQPSVVQFIHETVREFLLEENGLASIVPALTANLTGISHEILRIACSRYISMNQIPEDYLIYTTAGHGKNLALDKFKASMRERLPFLDYAITYLFEHAEEAQRQGISQEAFLRTQMDEEGYWMDPYRLWWNVLQRYGSRKIGINIELLGFCCENRYFVLAQKIVVILHLNLATICNNVLCRAMKKRDWEQVLLLVDYGADVNSSLPDGRTALYFAIKAGDIKLVQALLAMRADVNMPGEFSITPLYQAVNDGNGQIVKILLEAGADANFQEGERGTARQAASYKDNVEIVQMLLDKGADVNVQGGRCGTALQAAASCGHIETVRVLLDKGADVNVQGGHYCGTALQAASSQCHIEIVRVLLDKGADVNIQGGYHSTALQAASYHGSLEIVQMLLGKGADVNIQGGHYCATALQAASYRGSVEIVQILLDKGADVNIQGEHLGTALQAASRGHIEIVQMLLDKGADVNIQGGYYGTALQAASYKGSVQIVQMLLDKGADVNIQGGYYGTALQAASHGGSVEVVQMLLDKEADVNLKGGNWGSALKASRAGQEPRIQQLLLIHGAVE